MLTTPSRVARHSRGSPFRSHAMNSAVHNILIIEDYQDIAEMLYQYLDARGYALDYAADGVTGLHLAVTNDSSGYRLDLNLPGMDGLTLCEKLRNDAQTTPVLMLTARDTLADKIVDGYGCR